MPFLAVRIDLRGLDAEAAESAAFAAGAASVTYTDQGDDAILEPAPGEFRLWPATRLEALFDAAGLDAVRLGALAVELAARLELPLDRLDLAAIGDRAWEREWLRDFKPMRFGSRLWVCPTHATCPDPVAIVVTLDPGLAFGTGTHPTTRLCLEWLESLDCDGRTAIDYGCGSGILAIAACRLGASQVAAYDIDPQALVATHDNAAANGVLDRVKLCTTPEALPAAAELVLANILSGPLCELAGRLAGLVRPGGRLLLSGLLESQAMEVRAAYAPHLQLRVWRCLDGWCALEGERASQPPGRQ